jgi:hypothetical protein
MSGVNAVDVTHQARQMGLSSAYDQVVVVAHQAVGPGMRIEAFKRLACNRQKCSSVNIVFGDGLASITA